MDNSTPNQSEARARIISDTVEEAEQSCRYVAKHNVCNMDDGPYRDGFEVACEVCEKAIGEHVKRHADRIASFPVQPDPSMEGRARVERAAAYAFENVPKAQYSAGKGWSGIGGQVKQDWRDYAFAMLTFARATLPASDANREQLVRIMFDARPHTVISQHLARVTGLPIGETLTFDSAKKSGADFRGLERYADAILAALPLPKASVSGEVETLRAALAPFAKLGGPINGEVGRISYVDAIGGTDAGEELQLSTHAGNGTRIEVLQAEDFRRAHTALATPPSSTDERDGK